MRRSIRGSPIRNNPLRPSKAAMRLYSGQPPLTPQGRPFLKGALRRIFLPSVAIFRCRTLTLRHQNFRYRYSSECLLSLEEFFFFCDTFSFSCLCEHCPASNRKKKKSVRKNHSSRVSPPLCGLLFYFSPPKSKGSAPAEGAKKRKGFRRLRKTQTPRRGRKKEDAERYRQKKYSQPQGK